MRGVFSETLLWDKFEYNYQLELSLEQTQNIEELYCTAKRLTLRFSFIIMSFRISQSLTTRLRHFTLSNQTKVKYKVLVLSAVLVFAVWLSPKILHWFNKIGAHRKFNHKLYTTTVKLKITIIKKLLDERRQKLYIWVKGNLTQSHREPPHMPPKLRVRWHRPVTNRPNHYANSLGPVPGTFHWIMGWVGQVQCEHHHTSDDNR